MPTLMRAGPYRLFIVMADCVEPRHVHVEGNGGLAKFWLEPVSLGHSMEYAPREIHRIRALVAEQRETLLQRFDAVCQRVQP